MADDADLSVDDLLSQASRRRSVIITYDPDTDDIAVDQGTASPAEVRDIIARLYEDPDEFLFSGREQDEPEEEVE